jgi:4-diphosphocytidyl-2-C-methyl-D-erythritol kinase
VSVLSARAKINLALVVGPNRPDGKHEVTTVLQRIELSDRVALVPAGELRVEGFTDDTLVRRALDSLGNAAGVGARWAVRIDKQIPVAAGLGGGSSDAAAALRLANETLDEPLDAEALHTLAATLGADVPFFLRDGPQLGEGDGSDLTPLDLPQGYTVVVVVPADEAKQSTATVYTAFDVRGGAAGYEERRTQLIAALAAGDLAALPANDLAAVSPIADDLRALGAFRADLSGAGPAVYGLFEDAATAAATGARLEACGRVWVGSPAW